MRDLVEKTRLPASTIRFYLREGIVPEPERPTANSAIYDNRHVEALLSVEQIKRLAPELPLPQLRRVMELVGKGVEVPVALALHRSVANAGAQGSDGKAMSRAELCEAAGIEPRQLDSFVSVGIVVPLAGEPEAPFNEADLAIVEAIGQFLAITPDGIDAVAEAAAHIRKASAIEMAMRNAISRRLDDSAAAEISGRMQEWANLWHAYLFARLRLAEIAEHGLGTDTEGGKT